jgi:hypothetical protein
MVKSTSEEGRVLYATSCVHEEAYGDIKGGHFIVNTHVGFHLQTYDLLSLVSSLRVRF